MSGYNPIKKVGGVDIPCPSNYEWKMQDISSPNAGRTDDIKMQKMRIGQVRALSLQWDAPTLAEAATILTAFNPEYVTVECLDAMAGGFVTYEFYSGDKSGVLFNTNTGRWKKISFNIIQRNGVI